jgi:hypothetical protein
MTSRERLLRLFAGRDTDRVPIWLLFPWHPLGCYANVRELPAYAPVIDRIEQGDCDSFDRRGAASGFCYNANPDLRVARTVTEENGVRRDETTVTGPGLRLTRSHETGKRGTHIKYYIEDPAELAAILRVPYVPPRPPLGQLSSERAEFGERGLFMLDLGDPLGPLYHLMSATDFSMATATDYDALLYFTDAMEERVLALYRYFLEADAADCYFIVGSEFAGPPLVSPARFSEMSARYVGKICALIRSYGKISIVHYHGNLYHVRGGMKAINPDALHTVEAPPVGDCTITQAREVLDPMALIGNVQYDDLWRLTPDIIEAQVKDALAQAEGGRFILSPTAGPYDENITERAVANYLAMIDAGLKYGRRNG